MYACITDYPAIYNDAYRERRGDHTSFDRNVLPPLLLDFCKSRHLKRHLDISGGGGGLRDAMKQSGIETFVTDISADPSRAILELNLSQYDDESVERVRRSVNFGISPHLTTCFDVLEHIDKEHISAAARNLFELTERYLIVSISTRPSIRDNLLHASLISIQTWIAVFETAGFICDEIDVFPAATTQREFPDLPDYSLIKSWVGADLFDDIRFGEPRYLLLQKQTKGREDWAIKRSNIDNILDVAFRIVKRSQFKVENDTTYAFNLHHPQEWQYYRPLLDVLPRKQVKFFIRNQSIDDDFQRGVTGWLTRNGVSITQYEDVSELDWPSLRGSIVFTAGESSIDPKHIKSQQFVAAARLSKCRTVCMQHGIWPRAFTGSMVTFASQAVLTWSSDESERLNERRHSLLNQQLPWGALPNDQEFRIGSPKYSDQLIGPAPGLLERFGADAAINRAVVVAVKDMRGRFGIDNINNTFHSELGDLFSSNPDTLFVLRPHPADRFETFAKHRLHQNVRVLDNILGVTADISLNRILPSCDIVATSPSTMILDGLVSGKPTLVYETGQPLEYDHVVTSDIRALSSSLRSPLKNEDDTESQCFLKKYGNCIDDKFYQRISDLLPKMVVPENPDREAASVYTLTSNILKKEPSSNALKAAAEPSRYERKWLKKIAKSLRSTLTQ